MSSELQIEDVMAQTAPQTDAVESGAESRAPAGRNLDLGRRLLLAARAGDTALVLHLMARGAPFSTDWLGTSALHLAAGGGHAATCGVLLRAGVSRDARTKTERTPLQLAAAGGHLQAAWLLLRQGAAVEARDLLQMSALHWAAARGHQAVAAALLQHGADPGARNKFRLTPRDLAARHRHHALLHMLDDHARARAGPPPHHSELVYKEIKELLKNEKVMTIQKFQEIKTTNLKPVVLKSTANLENVAIEQNHFDNIPMDTVEECIETEAVEAEAENATPQAEPAGSVGGASGSVGGVGAVGGAVGGAEGAEGGAAALLRRHGITLLPADRGTTVLSALRHGRTVVLSDAGKLMLQESGKPATTKVTSNPRGVVLRARQVRRATPGGTTLSEATPGEQTSGKVTPGVGSPLKVISVNQRRLATRLPLTKIVNTQDLQQMKVVNLSHDTTGGRRPPVKIIMNKLNFQQLLAKGSSTVAQAEAGAGAGAEAGAGAGAESPEELRRLLAESQQAVARLTDELRVCRAQLALCAHKLAGQH